MAGSHSCKPFLLRWNRNPDVAPVSRSLIILPHASRAAVVEYQTDSGFFESRFMDEGLGVLTPVRILGTDGSRVLVQRLQRVRDLNFEVFKGPRNQRVWGRIPGEVVVASTDAIAPIIIEKRCLSADPSYVATPPHTPPLITLVDTDRVISVENMLVDEHKLVPLPTTPMSTVLGNLRQLALETGKVTKLARAQIRHALLAHACTLGYDTLTRMMTVKIQGFGLRKLFSLDIGECVDITCIALNEVGHVCKRSRDESPIDGEPHPRKEAASFMDTVDIDGMKVTKYKKNGDAMFTKYMTFAEHPDHNNEFLYNLASACPSALPALLRVLNTHVRTALTQLNSSPSRSACAGGTQRSTR